MRIHFGSVREKRGAWYSLLQGAESSNDSDWQFRGSQLSEYCLEFKNKDLHAVLNRLGRLSDTFHRVNLRRVAAPWVCVSERVCVSSSCALALPAQPLWDDAHAEGGEHASDGEDGHRQGPERGERSQGDGLPVPMAPRGIVVLLNDLTGERGGHG